MDTRLICQEILITTASRLFSRVTGTNDDEINSGLSQKEVLSKACWNGLLEVLLPEILPDLELININEGDHFLDLRFGGYDQQPEHVFSINPYLFLQSDREN